MATFFHGSKTESAGTAILVVVPPVEGKIARLTKFVYEAAATEHTLTVMRPIGQMKTTSPVLAAGNAIPVSSVDPGKTVLAVNEDLASADYIVVENVNGDFDAYVLTSVTGAIMTITGTTDFDIANNADVFAMYEVGRATHVQIPLNASVETDLNNIAIQGGFSPEQGGQTSRSGISDPLLIFVDNITNAGQIQYLAAEYGLSVTM